MDANWIYNNVNVTVTDDDRRALEKAKRMEAEKIKNGYRWIKLNERTQALIPCDEDGKPTKEGSERIKRLKAAL